MALVMLLILLAGLVWTREPCTAGVPATQASPEDCSRIEFNLTLTPQDFISSSGRAGAASREVLTAVLDGQVLMSGTYGEIMRVFGGRGYPVSLASGQTT
jgi:hypothetical protein